MLICCCAGSEYIALVKYVAVVEVNWGCAGGESAETNGSADLIADMFPTYEYSFYCSCVLTTNMKGYTS